ncbi:delta-like protein B [Aplysia californica]|uniref:Delta-like protein B n=1 Tax=Aplysia californica TaxID=6500 RepID=A0ABM1A0I7_APLCA|nr:delta-like protein B [Aplysia californica]
MCENNGSCVSSELMSGVVCECVPGFSGSHCELEDPATSTSVPRQGSVPRWFISDLDPTTLIILLAVLLGLGLFLLVAVSIARRYRRRKPSDFCFSLPRDLRGDMSRRDSETSSGHFYHGSTLGSDSYFHVPSP